MVARYCRNKRDHFSHLAASACAPEGYWHRLAKLTFAETYRACIESGVPFLLRRRVPKTCDHYSRTYGFTCPRAVPQEIDLTRYFDVVEVEAEHSGFRADVLLRSSNISDVLLVEFAVTHECEEAKISAGDRILEIRIDSEEAARSFAGRAVDDQVHDFTTYNFTNPEPVGDHCAGACERPVAVFRIYSSGKSVLAEKTPQELARRHRRGVVHEEILPSDERPSPDAFTRRVRGAHFRGVPVRNCFLCRYHGDGGFEAAVFCKIKRTATNSNAAAECDKYTPVSAAELRQIDRKNAEFAQKHVIPNAIRRMMGDFG